MKKYFLSLLLLAVAVIMPREAKAIGWPANYQGVMLQGFYWDSFTDTKWTNLESQADELSKYFKLIWIPNAGKAASQGMGYDPVYWFTNFNTRFGNETQLRSMIATYKAKGTGIIADVVINHRSGVSNWTDFPSEVWNGQTWHIGVDGICRDDEVAYASGQAKPTGNYDTGENFDGSRDLDHTNANVQNNCKNYCKFLLEDMGYAGFRLDMVKGYGGQYTKIYNQYSRPTYCVGEYWDGSYDALAAWIEATGKTSAAFDFAFKYACNEAFSSGDLTKLVWMANGNTPQPAGLIHFGYPQYAVTFLDNHDTYRDDWNKFNGNVVAANAFMLCSPGTPCVFLPHWKEHKAEIAKLIEVRNKVGVTNMSAVRVLKTTSNCYMAEVTGTKGRLVVKIGANMDAPQGWNDSQIYCSGTDYCVWSTAEGGSGGGGGGDLPGSYPATLYLQGHVSDYAWSPAKGTPATGSNGVYKFSNVKIVKADDSQYGFFSFATAIGSTWDIVNGSDRYGAADADTHIADGQTADVSRFAAGTNASSCSSWGINPGTYSFTVDLSKMTLTVGNSGNSGNNPTAPAQMYLIGHINNFADATTGDWDPSKGVKATPVNNVFSFNNVEVNNAGDGYGYISLATVIGPTWDDVNSGDRYGASTKDETLNAGATATITKFPQSVSASSANAWMVKAGRYNVTANFGDMKITLTPTSGIEAVDTDSYEPAEYYTLTGIRVAAPTSGIYLMRRGTTVTKIFVK